MASTPFARWTASDVDLTVLNQHCGPSLKELGVSACELNLFKLFDCQRIVDCQRIFANSSIFTVGERAEELLRGCRGPR